ncbi:sigma 54-interacting transcriptional regulator [candidate division KSB1 bacterium]|nr:sigma 54-interacting transcriptional regulator [candidate division KSB1 bacterium]
MNDQYESLFELAAILSQQNDFEEILRLVSLQASTRFDAEVASIMMINPGTQHTIKTIMKEGKALDRQRYRLAEMNIVGWVTKNKQPFLSANLKTDSRFDTDTFEDETVRSAMCVPLRCGGLVIGFLLAMNKSGDGEFDEAALHLLEKMASLTAPYLSNAQKIQEYFHAPLPEAALLTKYEPLGLLGKSKSFIELLRAVEAAARCEVRVLLEGQSGAGKERIARAIHQLSVRKDHPFVAIDCGAIPENLIESELFGHIKGAFTGATHDRKGLIEEAHQGTLFMDEVANLPYDMQAKLLRVLQEGEIRVVGSNRPRKVDVRIISACTTSLRKLVEQQKFREDLFYRLHVYPIHVPTLNERREDIPLLANYFLKKFARQQQKAADSFHGSLLIFMQQRKWAGNIRELENFVERLVTLASPDMTVLNPKILPPEFQKEFKKLTPSQQEHPLHKSLQESLDEVEEQLIHRALEQNDWNQSKAARALKISERNMRYKMEKLGIVRGQRA